MRGGRGAAPAAGAARRRAPRRRLGSRRCRSWCSAHLLASGQHETHLRAVRRRQRTRHLLVALPEGADDLGVAEGARQAGVLVHPLSWHRVRPGPPGLVLGYAAHPPDVLRDAVRRLAAALR